MFCKETYAESLDSRASSSSKSSTSHKSSRKKKGGKSSRSSKKSSNKRSRREESHEKYPQLPTIIDTSPETMPKPPPAVPDPASLVAKMPGILGKGSSASGQNASNRDDWVTIIKTKVKFNTFKKFKFVTDSDGEERVLSEVISLVGLSSLESSGKEGAAQLQLFCTKYASVIMSEINATRNYVQAQVKKVCMAWLAVNSGKLPKMKDIEACYTRTIDLDSEEKQELAVWYVDKFLPACTGNSIDFSPKIRYYETISDAKSDVKCLYPDMTPETEAFGIAVLESNYTKWPKLFDLEKNPELHGKKTAILKTKKEDFVPKEGVRYFFLDEHPALQAKYTTPDSGQEKYGGWKDEGVRRWVKIRSAIKKARKSKAGRAWEAKILEVLREINGITMPTHEQQQKLAGKKTENEAKRPKISASELYDDSDDEEDDEEIPATEV